jgi:methylmalonyl-CoA/ethylmalonyl-CoA epimerase
MTEPAGAQLLSAMGMGRYRLHHVGIVVPNLERAVAGYAGAFECRETSVPFDDQAQRVRVAFVRVDTDTWLEFIEPAGADSPVTQFLSKTRGGYHHLAFEVDDIEAAVREFETAGAMVVCRPVIGFEGRRVAFLFPRLQPSLLTEFVEPRPISWGDSKPVGVEQIDMTEIKT